MQESAVHKAVGGEMTQDMRSFFFFFFFFAVPGLEDEFFRDRVSQTVCLGWLQTVILLISAS
jgi:hypothetical protein